ncbi:MAG: guanylate kinase [Candidatus Saccharimonadales bacterium]|jgi:guanylate kinase
MEKKDFIVWASTHQSTYVPSDAAKAKLANVDLVAIVGPTGVGKTTIIGRLAIPYVRSTVSREKRPTEQDKHTYYFTQDYLGIIKDVKEGNYVQFIISSSGEFYGTKLSEYPDSGVCVMSIAADQVPSFQKLGFKSVKCIYIMPPSYIEWMNRIGGVRTKDLLDRISEARQSVEIVRDDENYSFILNDNLDLAVAEVVDIINGNPVDEHRARLAHDTADIILKRIGEQ